MYISKISIRFSLILLILTFVSLSSYAKTKVRMRDFIDTVQVNPLRKDTSYVSRGALRPGRVMPLSDSLVRKDTLAVSDSL